jgi:hypothetical protein
VKLNFRGNGLMSEISYTPVKELKPSICTAASSLYRQVSSILAMANYENPGFFGFLSFHKN